MKTTKKAKALLAALALAGIPLITTATCNPRYGTVDIYRNDDYHEHSFWDVVYDDCYYCDDWYYDEYYYEEIIVYP